MHELPVFEKAEAYLSVHLSHTGPGGMVKAPGPFITLSRESGTGGSHVGHLLADRLQTATGRHWSVYSANLIDEMLLSAGLPSQLARFLPEDRISEIHATIGEIVGLHPNLWSLIDKTNALIRRLARDGHAIFLGRGANFATRGIANGVHARLVAPVAARADRTSRWLGISLERAATYNARRDLARIRYVDAHFNSDVTDPNHYDVVLNVAAVPADTCAALIAGFVPAPAIAATTHHAAFAG